MLETLVTRGRSTENVREQREITFGLADLSTRINLHEKLVRTGGISTLIDILSTAQDAEAQQFAAIAVANTSSTTTLSKDIVELKGAVASLIQYVGNESADSVGRQYCAMALGNLLAEPANHQLISKLGVTAALVTMLKNCTDSKELESGRHAAFALSNLASNLGYHEQIVEQGAIEVLIALAYCEDLDTQRQALSALRGLCLSASIRLNVVKRGILDPLILMSRSDEVEILREVSSALNCLSLERENKKEISYRAISTIIRLMLSGHTDIELHASSAISNLLEAMDVHTRFIEEKGISPLIALCSAADLACRTEATRAVAHLSYNPDLIGTLIDANVLQPLIKSIKEDGSNGQYSALAIANCATNTSSLSKIVHAGAVPHIVSMISNVDNVNCKRYGALAIANITACQTFHPPIINAGAPEALFALTSSSDIMSKHYVACSLANLSSNTVNHGPIVEVGGIQPILALASDADPDIYKQAVAALRGFSATGNNKNKIVQEGGLKPLCHLLRSKDEFILREVTACLCNLSLGDENKFEVINSGAVSPLISLLENEDHIVASHAYECLASLAEMTDNQDFIVREGAITPCVRGMRSRHIEIQRESGRLIANLSASDTNLAADAIVEENGHLILISYLLSQDKECQRVGLYGVGNICTHDQHRAALIKAGALEPLTSLVRSEAINLEIRRFAMLAIANLATSFKTHDEFVAQRTIPMLVSVFSTEDLAVKNYAAYAISQLSKNSDLMELITSEGGLEPVLYLGRSDDKTVQREVLPALTTLSFMDCNKVPICANGSLPSIIGFISETTNSSDESQLAMCTIANLVESASNMQIALNHGCVSFLVDALKSESGIVQRESCRAIGNLAINIMYCDSILKHLMVLPRLVECFRGKNVECQRMAAFAISNLSSNIKSHHRLLKSDVLSLVTNECQASLDTNKFSDHETVHFCLLIIANLTGDKLNHSNMKMFFDLLMDFTRHRDAKCRQHAILAIGNMCSELNNANEVFNAQWIDVLIASSFHHTTDESVNAQYQAIAGLHGLSKNIHLRETIVDKGGLEPLILGARGSSRPDVEIQREATATIANLALEEKNRLVIAKSGVLPALVNLARTSDYICVANAVTAITNLAETSDEIHSLLLNTDVLGPMCELAQNETIHVDIKRSISCCFALFASNKQMHQSLLREKTIDSLRILVGESTDVICERYGTLAIANLALADANYRVILEAKLMQSIIPLVNSEDIQTLRGVAFALHSLSQKESNHLEIESGCVIECLIPLLRCKDRDTVLQVCLTVKYLSNCNNCRIKFVECNGLEPLLALCSSDCLQTKRELTAALRNISLSDENKVPIRRKALDYITTLCRDSDREVCHQACGLVGNISEMQENKSPMIENGILHHLQAAIRFMKHYIPVLRESARAIANLSSDIENTTHIVSSGALTPLIRALNMNDDILCRRFAAMTLSNLAINTEVHARVIHEVGIPILTFIARQGDRKSIDINTQQHGMACLANLASCKKTHVTLTSYGCTELAMDHVKSSDLDIRRSALLLIANLSSNNSNHSIIKKCCNMHDFIENLVFPDPIVQLYSVACLRGISTDIYMRKKIISDGGTEILLSLVNSDENSIRLEVLFSLCNLSIGECMGGRANGIMPNLILILCKGDSLTHQMFGAVAIGNTVGDLKVQTPVFDRGALKTILKLSKNSGVHEELRRCMAYAICNLSAESQNRWSIITQGGLASIIYLCYTGDVSDMLIALSTLRCLSASVDAMRLIYEEGVMRVLLLGVKSENVKCKREVASILVNLSSNEKNKVDLARSSEMKDVLSLLEDIDVSFTSDIFRALGNICEKKELHNYVLRLVNTQMIALFCCPGINLEIQREAVRCIVNLSSNFKTHGVMLQQPILENLSEIVSSIIADIQKKRATPPQIDTIRLSTLALANFCMNVDTHKDMNMTKLLLIFHGIISLEPVSPFAEFTEARCYACMSISSICTDPNASSGLVKVGTIPALLKLIQSQTSHELNMLAAFVLNKLAMAESTHEEMTDIHLSLMLAKHVSLSNKQCLTYSIATLRRLSDNNKIRSFELITSDLLNFFSKACLARDIERSREIAAAMCHISLLDKTKLLIAKSSMFQHILAFCDSDEIETSRFALGALANVADDIQTHALILRETSIIQQMLRLTQNPSISIVRESIRVLANLMSSVPTHKMFIKEGGISLMSHIVDHLHDNDSVHNVSVLFRKLAANDRTHEMFFSEDGIRAAIALAAHDEKKAILQGLAALRDLSSNPAFHLVFVEVGAMNSVIDLAASSADVDVKIVALGVVRHLSVSIPLKERIFQSGIMNIIATCIDHSKDSDLLLQCASIIANIAEYSQNKATLVQMGILRYLITLSKCISVDIKQETSRAFLLLSSAQENINEFGDNVLISVIDLLSCHGKEIVCDAASTISNLAVTVEMKSLIGKCNGIPSLVEMLKSPYESCKVHTCRALSRLTDLEENKVIAYLNGALKQLLHLCNKSTNTDLLLVVLMVLVNLASCADHHHEYIQDGSLTILLPFLGSDISLLRQYAVMILCNLTSNDSSQDHVVRRIDLLLLIELMNDANVECKLYATMTVCNLASTRINVAAILTAGGLTRLTSILINGPEVVQLQRAALLAAYNISTCGSSIASLVGEKVLQPIIGLCRSPDKLCRILALLVLSNVACNDKTRISATEGGGLQAAVHALKDEDILISRFACICLSNMANKYRAQSQILVHGGLPSLVTMTESEDSKRSKCALMCLSNLSANESNHSSLIKQGVLRSFISASSDPEKNSNVYHQFGIANFTSNPEVLPQIGKCGGIRPLLALVNSDNIHFQFSAISGLRRLALIRDNRDRLIEEGFLSILVNHSCNIDELELKREIASCFCNLTLNQNQRLNTTKLVISELSNLSMNDDPETIRLSLGAIGNLAEDIETHQYMNQANILSNVISRLENTELDIKREASRACANLLSSVEFHPEVVEHGLDNIILLSAEPCDECRYTSAISFRKLSSSKISHYTLINNGLRNMLALTKVSNVMTRKHAATAVRNLCASDMKDASILFKNGTVIAMIDLVKDNEKELQNIALATLRHLSRNKYITYDFSQSVLVKYVVRCISWAIDDMKSQIAGLMANLSEHRECHSIMITQGVIPALGKLAYTENREIEQDCGRTFANLCSNEGKQIIIYRQGGLKTLVRLSKSKSDVCQRYVAIAMRFMVSTTEVQRYISKENAFSPFPELFNSELLDYKRASAASMASMSLNQTGRTTVLRKGGIRAVLRLCLHLDSCVQRDSVLCVANFVNSPEFRQYLTKEGGVETLKAVTTTSDNTEILRDTARALLSLSAHIPSRAIMISQDIPQSLSKLATSPDKSTQKCAALAMCNLCQGTRVEKEAVVKQGTLHILLFLLRCHDMDIKRCASLAIAALSFGSDRNKSEIIGSGFVRPLIEAMAFPDVNMRRSALLAVNCVSLGMLQNTKQYIFEENGLFTLLTVLKTEDEECIHSGIYMLGTLAKNMDIRDVFAVLEVVQLLADKISTSSLQTKRAAAYLLSLLSENPEHHDTLRDGGALESVITLASLVDDECQGYSAFTLALLANNKSLQARLVKLGAVRLLVSMMSNNSDAKHYASLALLKLAENFEHHITIAEEGGIQALLALGRSKNTELNYSAQVAVGLLANNLAQIHISKDKDFPL